MGFISIEMFVKSMSGMRSNVDGIENRDKACVLRNSNNNCSERKEQPKKSGQVKKEESSILINSPIKSLKGERLTTSVKYFSKANVMRTQVDCWT